MYRYFRKIVYQTSVLSTNQQDCLQSVILVGVERLPHIIETRQALGFYTMRVVLQRRISPLIVYIVYENSPNHWSIGEEFRVSPRWHTVFLSRAIKAHWMLSVNTRLRWIFDFRLWNWELKQQCWNCDLKLLVGDTSYVSHAATILGSCFGIDARADLVE